MRYRGFKVWTYRKILPVLMDNLPRDSALVLWRACRRWTFGPRCHLRGA